MSTSPLLPCKQDPPLLHRITLRASFSTQPSMDEDHPHPLVHHGGDRLPAIPPRAFGGGSPGEHLAPVHPRTPPLPERPEWRRPPPSMPAPHRTALPPSPHVTTSPLPAAPTTTTTVQPHHTPPAPPFQREIITLAGGGSALPRAQNEYVVNPALIAHQSGPGSHVARIPTRPTQVGSRPTPADPSGRPLLPPHTGSHGGSDQTIISTQPTSTGGIKNTSTNKDHNKKGQISPPADNADHLSPAEDDTHDSIICKKCGKCKCRDCTSPRQLPAKWVCHERYECSANQVVEYCSCLQCVKCLFYHCENSEDGLSMADVPCACCERPHCCKRWTCMGLMSLCVPCLCLYWPLRAVVAMTTACYNGCSRRGCQCHRDKSGQALNKRPLIDSESSST